MLPCRSEPFQPADAVDSGIHALAVAGGSLWCCAADGNVSIFDFASGAKQKAGCSHGERQLR